MCDNVLTYIMCLTSPHYIICLLISCAYLYIMCLPIYHVPTYISCAYLYIMCLPVYHVPTYISCAYLYIMCLPVYHGPTYIICLPISCVFHKFITSNTVFIKKFKLFAKKKHKIKRSQGKLFEMLVYSSKLNCIPLPQLLTELHNLLL